VAGVFSGIGPRRAEAAGRDPAQLPDSDPPTAERGDGRPRWKPRWTSPARAWLYGTLSPDGKILVWVDAMGRITWVDTASGKAFLRNPSLRGAERLIVDNRGVVVAWAPLNPGRTGVWVVRPVDAPAVRRDLGAPLWSAALDSRQLGVWVGTGDKVLHWVPIDGGDIQVSSLPGIADSLTATPTGSIASLWLESGVCAVDPAGLLRWHRRSDDRARRWRPLLSEDGKRLFLVSSTGPTKALWRVHRLDPATGDALWETSIVGKLAEALLTVDGGRLALTTWVASTDPRDPAQRKLHMIDEAGNWLFRDKGSAVFEPLLAALSVRGERITVVDGDRGISTLDRSGRTIARRIGLPGAREIGRPARVMSVLATPDGRRMVLIRGDGRMTGYEALA